MYYRKVWNAKFRKRISNPCIASFLSIVSNFSFVSNDGVRERCFSSCHRRGTRKKILSTYDESNPRSSDSLLQCPITEPQRLYGERGHYEVHVWFLMGTQNIFFVLCSFQKSYLCLFLVCFIFLINNICFLLLHNCRCTVKNLHFRIFLRCNMHMLHSILFKSLSHWQVP